MRHLKCCALAATLLLWVASASQAQTVTVVNSASFANPALPSGSIAQGSMFVGFAAGGMGPANIAFPKPWPFPTELAGTSVEVTVGATTVECFMVYTSAGQIAAILPSNTPIGMGMVTVKFNGSTAATGDIKVVKHSFGIFTIKEQGFGPIVGTDPLAGTAVYSVTNAAAPGDFIDIWGTGLGPVGFPDEGPTSPANLGFDVRVFLGDLEVPVEYAGRSGCCSAIDLVRVRAPAELSGCFLPVTVVVEGRTSNYGTIPVNAGGGDCQPDAVFGGLGPEEFKGGGSLRVGNVALIRTTATSGIPVPSQSFEIVSDQAAVSYQEFDILSIAAFSAIVPINHVGSCSVFQFSGNASYDPGITLKNLDAGPQLTISGPGGNHVIPKIGDSYFKDFSFAFPLPLEAKQQITFPTYYEPGLHTVSAPGGADVGAHMATITIPQDFEWFNSDIDEVDRSTPLNISYSAPGYDYVQIRGFAPAIVGDEGSIGAIFFCAADPAAGLFTVPLHVLMSLPNSPLVNGFGTGGVWVGGIKTTPFSAPGVDRANTIYTDTIARSPVDFN